MEFINKTLGDLLEERAAQYPDNDALVYVERDLRYSYKEFNEVCNRAAKGFLKMGIKKGDHVAMWATNYPQWVITMFATAKIGAVLVTVNINYKIFELEYLLRQSDSMTLLLIDGFKDCDYVEIVNKLCPELAASKPGELTSEKFPFLKNIINIDNTRLDGMFTWDDVMEMGKDIPDSILEEIKKTLDVHDVINMQYTSGTTGFPKGVMLTHYNIINNGLSIGDCMKFTHKDRLCIPVPFFHCFGMVLAIMASVTHGTTMVPIDYFKPLEVLKSIETEKCTAVHGVPTMFIFIMDHPDFNKYDLSSLRTGIMAGSPCPIELMKKAIDQMGLRELTITYGQTESSPGISQTRTDDSIELRVNTVGRVFPNVEAKIADPETGETLPCNTIGEICCRGYNVMKGYYKMPEATENVIDKDGWLHTGDLGTIDENGYFRITGRMKDMIIRGGENIYPREIEELLYTHPKISDVQVIGVPDKDRGEEVMACIIIKEGEALTVDDVKQYVRENMARHKVPKYVAFINEFPMTASGKIQKFKLREWAIEEFGLQDAANIETA